MKDAIRLTENVQRALREAESWIVTGVRTDLAMWCEESGGDEDLIESPIEGVFGVWWQAVSMASRVGGTSEGLFLHPQREVVVEERKYRLDFEVYPEDPDDLWDASQMKLSVTAPKIAVEMDGHEFHEKTKAQVTYRNQRDRDLQMAGWKVFHFSGSEIIREPLPCVQRVYGYAEAEWGAFRRAVRAAKRNTSAGA